MAAFVVAGAFTIHVLNGLVIERTVLHLTSYDDYAKVDKIAEAVGSAPWRLSGLGHLCTGFAMVVLAVGIRQWMDDRGSRLGPLAHGAALVSSAGFVLNGLSNLLGAQAAHLVADQNPAVRDAVFAGFGVFVPIFNALGIVTLGWVCLLVGRFVWVEAVLPRWFAVLSFVAGVAGVAFAFAYVPVYLLLDLGWALSLGLLVIRLRRSSRLVSA